MMFIHCETAWLTVRGVRVLEPFVDRVPFSLRDCYRSFRLILYSSRHSTNGGSVKPLPIQVLHVPFNHMIQSQPILNDDMISLSNPVYTS